MTRVSLAVPLYNEESVLPAPLSRVRDVIDCLLGGPHEMVFVDGGSSDRSPALLRRATALDPRLLVISLSRDFGHQAAISAALDHAATGHGVIVMGGDLQDPSAEAIPQLIGAVLVWVSRRWGRASRIIGSEIPCPGISAPNRKP